MYCKLSFQKRLVGMNVTIVNKMYNVMYKYQIQLGHCYKIVLLLFL